MFRTLAFFLLFATSCSTMVVRNYSKRLDNYQGQPFPDLELLDTAGHVVSMTQHYGKTVYVNMWVIGWKFNNENFKEALAQKERFKKDTNIVFVNICYQPPSNRELWLKEIASMQAHGFNYYIPDSTYRRKEAYINEFTNHRSTFHLLDTKGCFLGWDVSGPGFLSDYEIYRATAGVSSREALVEYIQVEKEGSEPNQWFARHFGMSYNEYVHNGYSLKTSQLNSTR